MQSYNISPVINTSTRENTREQKKRLYPLGVRMLERFEEIYDYKPKTNAESLWKAWHEALIRFSVEAITEAFNKIINGETEFNKYPPKIPEFVKLLRTIQKPIIESNDGSVDNKKYWSPWWWDLYCDHIDKSFPHSISYDVFKTWFTDIQECNRDWVTLVQKETNRVEKERQQGFYTRLRVEI